MNYSESQQQLIDLIKEENPYLLVEAPAGTGKTYCCIQAVKTICECELVQPFQKALVLTFSRNARAQLLKELWSISDNGINKHIEINNYHSFFKKYIDIYYPLVGIKHEISVVESSEFEKRIMIYAKNHKYKQNMRIKSNVFDDYLLQNDTLIEMNPRSKYSSCPESEIREYIELVNSYTIETGDVCFDQFGYLINKILNKSSTLCASISRDYPYVILDEYQDTNFFQEAFLDKILKVSKAIFFADSKQMIYEFRGSSPKRITCLSKKYSSIKRVMLDEIFRYKDKPDLVSILTDIRCDKEPNYDNLMHGKLIVCHSRCDENWEYKPNQLGLFCNSVFYSILSSVINDIKINKSIAILCRTNAVTERIAKNFIKQKMKVNLLTNTSSLVTLSTLIKKIAKAAATDDFTGLLLASAALCTINREVEGLSIIELEKLDFACLKRKRKVLFKEITLLYTSYADKSNIRHRIEMVLEIIKILFNHSYLVDFSQKAFLEHCCKLETITNSEIDKIMLQRQYISSFSKPMPGVHVITAHQSKGKEFDNVYVIDVEKISHDKNLLYVTHSRMKENLFPVKVINDGFKFR